MTQGSDPSVSFSNSPNGPISKQSTDWTICSIRHNKNTPKCKKQPKTMRFKPPYTALIDIYIYICSLKQKKVITPENNDIYDKGIFQSDPFSYVFIKHTPALR